VANLPLTIAERQRDQALRRLRGLSATIDLLPMTAPSPGTFLLLLARFEHSQACFCALGARGKPAERVADEAATELLQFLSTEATVDHHLADQILLPAALAKGISEWRTDRVTLHLTTNAAVITRLLPVRVAVEGEIDREGRVVVEGAGYPLCGGGPLRLNIPSGFLQNLWSNRTEVK
jgi:RNA 3'-terminal phosphate cyclase (ATP)